MKPTFHSFSLCVAPLLAGVWSSIPSVAQATEPAPPVDVLPLSAPPNESAQPAVGPSSPQENPVRPAIMGMLAKGIGLAVSLDLGRYVRVGASAGGFGAGDGGGSWKQGLLGTKVVGSQVTSQKAWVTSLWLESGILSTHDEQSPDGYYTYRDTLGIPVLATVDISWLSLYGGGFSLRFSGGICAALSQEIQSNEYRTWEPYGSAGVAAVAAGYHF